MTEEDKFKVVVLIILMYMMTQLDKIIYKLNVLILK